MSANFAPYQDENPDDPPPSARPHHAANDDWSADSARGTDLEAGARTRPGGFGNGLGADERPVDPYSTSLPMRIEIAAVAAYVALPPAGGAALLMLEHRNDYVRFHAWQGSLVFTVLFVLHIIFSFTAVLSFMLLVFDLVLIGFLAWHAYNDCETLERYELPWFGRLASSFVDSE